MKKTHSFQSTTDTQSVGLITVCVSPSTLGEITGIVEQMPWSVSHDALDKYVGADSRSHWSIHVRNASVRLAVVDLDQDSEAAIETIEFIHQSLPGKVSVIALSSDKDPSLILRTMRAGCSEYLEKPFDAAHFSEALARLARRSTATAATVAPGQILTVIGAKGGVGATTLAVHLAINLARFHKKKTLLIDNHSELGHVCLYLGLDGKHYSFHELLSNVNRLDIDLLKGFIVCHASGVDVLASPDSHGGLRHADPSALQHTLDFLREEYDYIVIDAESSLDEAGMAVVDRSDQVCLVATPEIAAIRDLSRYVDALIQYGQPTEKLRLVVNRASAKGAMDALQIEKALRLPLDTRIPNSYANLAKASNLGVPLSYEDKNDFSSHMRAWSGKIVAGAAGSTAPAVKKGLVFWK